MKKIFFVGLIILLFQVRAFAYTSWENSSDNFNNSKYNYENSPSNYKNSPYNWNNSPSNPNAKNIIYNSNGKPQGYAVPKSNGTGVNLYDFNGNFQGYSNN